jgi:hypothetical protein
MVLREKMHAILAEGPIIKTKTNHFTACLKIKNLQCSKATKGMSRMLNSPSLFSYCHDIDLKKE